MSSSPAHTVIATHNIMGGRLIAHLMGYYQHLARSTGIGVLCLQENRLTADSQHARDVASALGSHYAVAHDPNDVSVATIYDRRSFELEQTHLIALPALPRLSWFERLYMTHGERKHALISTFRHLAGTLTVVNFHLEAGGGNLHRHNQMQRIAQWLENRGVTGPLNACGDTNCFALRGQLSALKFVLSPLRHFGLQVEDDEPTHFFSRMREPRLIKRVSVALGRLGIDYPRLVDVVCTNLPVQERGQIHTRESDHDLVWARIALAR